MEKIINKAQDRAKRKRRIRKRMIISSSRPRLCVYKSLNHIYAQIIDDIEKKVITQASTLSKELKGSVKKGNNKEAAGKVGELIAKYAKEKKIAKVVFDRSGYVYHGRLKALADGARKAGLKF